MNHNQTMCREKEPTFLRTQCQYFVHFGKSWKLNRLSTGAGGGFLNMWRVKVAVVNTWLVPEIHQTMCNYFLSLELQFVAVPWCS